MQCSDRTYVEVFSRQGFEVSVRTGRPKKGQWQPITINVLDVAPDTGEELPVIEELDGDFYRETDESWQRRFSANH
ncbi:MAG: hypothetical protein SFX73_27415 [Kofleriaceae bacterium]|nr:hypothetical protein [Kofleriaceae bacterium]